jgi:hypothetical protein
MKKLLVFILFFTIVIDGFCQKWRASGIGVGLIVVDENYDKRLNIAQKGDNWDIKSYMKMEHWPEDIKGISNLLPGLRGLTPAHI